MPSVITVAELFKAAKLRVCGPVRWGAKVPETKPGVYVIAIVSRPKSHCGSRKVSYLPAPIALRWIPRQPVIYIGRTRRSLSRRVHQFYRQEYGDKSPHRGGQAVRLLKCGLWVYWSPTDNPFAAEDKMIERFREKVGRLPFGNRMRSSRVQTRSKKTARG
jgi:hypothetical protein